MGDNATSGLGRLLGASGARRHALKASLAGVLAAVVQRGEALAGKRHNSCESRTKKCTGTNECCGSKSGLIACRPYLSGVGKDTCAPNFTDKHCCGLEGARCKTSQDNCGCCDDLVCADAGDGSTRCQPSEP